MVVLLLGHCAQPVHIGQGSGEIGEAEALAKMPFTVYLPTGCSRQQQGDLL